MTGWTRPNAGSGRVLFPASVDPRESLVGLLHKTASDNLHTNVGGLLEKAGYPHARAFDLAHNRLDRLPNLALVLGVDHRIVAALAHPEIRKTRALRTVRFLGAEIPDYDLTSRRRRISPQTLAREPFHRAVWMHRLLPFCPHSLELLLDICPICSAPLGWFRAEGLTACGSKGCDAELGEVSRPHLAKHMEAYRRMAALVAPQDTASTTHLESGLRKLDTGAVFELGWRLACVVTDVQGARRDADQLPPERIVETLAVADDLLLNWPKRLPDMLREGLTRDGNVACLTRLERLRRCAAALGSRPETAALLRGTYPDLVAPGHTALRSLNRSVLTGTEAAKAIGIRATRLARMNRSAAIGTLSRSGEARRFFDYNEEIVVQLAAAKAGSIPINAIAERFGIALHGVEQLIAHGLLAQETHAALQAIYSQSLVTAHSVEALLAKLETGASKRLADGVPLRRAVKAIAGEKPWAPIFAALVEGRIGYCLAEGGGRVMSRVYIDATSAPLLATLHFDRGEHPQINFAKDMTLRDAGEALNLNPALLPIALKEELGWRAGARPGIAEVQLIARTRISAAEICARASDHSRRLPAALRHSALLRVGAAGWVRSEVEPLLCSPPPRPAPPGSIDS